MSIEVAPTLIRATYDRLRHDVLSGRWAPGRKLRMHELREHYQVGASPLREALNRLASEGFFRVVPQVGCWVATVDEREVADFFRLVASKAHQVCIDLIRKGRVRESAAGQSPGQAGSAPSPRTMPTASSATTAARAPSVPRSFCRPARIRVLADSSGRRPVAEPTPVNPLA